MALADLAPPRRPCALALRLGLLFCAMPFKTNGKPSTTMEEALGQMQVSGLAYLARRCGTPYDTESNKKTNVEVIARNLASRLKLVGEAPPKASAAPAASASSAAASSSALTAEPSADLTFMKQQIEELKKFHNSHNERIRKLESNMTEFDSFKFETHGSFSDLYEKLVALGAPATEVEEEEAEEEAEEEEAEEELAEEADEEAAEEL